MYDNAEQLADRLRKLQQHAEELGYEQTGLALARLRQTLEDEDVQGAKASRLQSQNI
jgi:hypothetical protein